MIGGWVIADNIEKIDDAFRNWTNELGATVTSPEQQAKDANVSGFDELPDQASKDKANANFDALYAELGSEPANVATWTRAVYGDGGKIPAAKLAESNADLIKASANYNLAVMADPVTITPGATADGKFTFAIADADRANPVVAATKARELMAYTSDLKTKFARDITGKAIGAEVADGLIEVGFTGKDLDEKAADAGFMKVDLSVE